MSGGSGTGAVSYADAPGACSVNASSGLVTMTSGTGTCSVTATKAADTNYSSATSAAATVAATLASQATLTVTGMPTSAQAYGATFTVGTSGGSGTGAVKFAATGACSVNASSGLVTMTSGSGTCSVTATKAADTNYKAVTSAPATVAATATGCASVSTAISVTAGGFVYNFSTGLFSQTVTLKNTGSTAIAGPISYVLDNLSSNATLSSPSPSGLTGCIAPSGSPYINVSSTSMSANQTISVTLLFNDPNKTTISYTPQVLTGSGPR
jgi:hypothetical protein